MTPDEFVARRRSLWDELEGDIRAARRGRLADVDSTRLERFGLLTRRAASDLAIATRDYPDSAVTDYLNGLCSRANPLLRRGRAPSAAALLPFISGGLPRRFRAAGGYMLVSLALLVTGTAAGWAAVALRPDLAPTLVPSSLFDQMARGQIHATLTDAPFAAAFILQNNIKVALLSFAGGVFVGVPTVAVLLVNGWQLGTLGAAVHSGGYDLSFWPLLAPHGVMELSILVFAGGTGLMVGDSLLRPGLLSRAEALAGAARRAVVLVLSLSPVLVVTGILEAYVSPSALAPAAKLAVGLGTGALLYSWLLLGGRRDPERGAAPSRAERLTAAWAGSEPRLD